MRPSLIRDLYHLASDYHGGQWSRGYRLLCRTYSYARRHGITLYPYRPTRHYRQLSARYGNKL